tara:strand:+ start:1568 stop:2029 length:462 start_codon:yes stop_codon:yes gene_type:complete
MDLSNDLIEFDYIDNFLTLEQDYNIFYKTNIDTLNINIHYYENYKIINSISIEYNIVNNIINSEALLYLIKKYSNNKYILDLIIYFNFDIDNNEIKKFMNNNLPITNYFKIYKSINDLIFHDTISFFSDLNSIDIFLKPKQEFNKKNRTRKNK